MNDLSADLASLRIDRDVRPHQTRPWAKWLGLFLLLAVVGVVVWWWLGRPQPVAVRIAPVEVRGAGDTSARAVLNASGYVTARRRATVSSRVTGRVVEVLVDEGMTIRQGQVLARLEDVTARAALRLAEAQLDAARTQLLETEVRIREADLALGRQRRLADEGVVAAADLDTASAQADALRARLEAARQDVRVAQEQVALRRTDLDDLVIRAPFSGKAISKDAQPGEMISPVSAGGGFTRTGICTIVDMTSLEIEVDVNESYINRIEDGQPVEAVLDAYPDWRIPAHVITTVPTADRQKATVLVRIGFDALDPRLLPDMGVKVTFLRPAGADDTPRETPTMWVPAEAVRQQDGQSIVFLATPDDTAERRAVRAGRTSAGATEILSGLTATDRVIVGGPADLTDGAAIEETTRP
jgi:RND family efflux transporter MFP subunit